MHSTHWLLNSIIMRPSSLGGGRILRRTLSVRLSVCPSVPLADVLCLQLHRLTSEHPKLKNFGFRLWASVTYVLFGMRRGPHIVRPSRPHKFLFITKSSKAVNLFSAMTLLTGQQQGFWPVNKLCPMHDNMPPPAVCWTVWLGHCGPAVAHPYACGAQRALLPIAVGAININKLMNINDVRESATIFPHPCKLTLTFWPWKWCPSHVWCGLPDLLRVVTRYAPPAVRRTLRLGHCSPSLTPVAPSAPCFQ